MIHLLPNRHTLSLLLPCIFLLASCAGPLEYSYMPPKDHVPLRLKRPVLVKLEPFRDSRDGVRPVYLGEITAIVSDMNATELVLDRDVAGIVTEAFMRHLKGVGYTVQEENGTAAVDFTVTGEVKKFRLDIGPRDEIEIILTINIVEDDTENVLWTDTVSANKERYSGVMGNSRRTISMYISSVLGEVVNRAMEGFNIFVTQTEGTMDGHPPAKVTDRPLQDGKGALSIKTDPPRSKIYIGEVYYGLSPLQVDIGPGIYGVRVEMKGYREVEERVSVRTDSLTEMEVEMEMNGE